MGRGWLRRVCDPGDGHPARAAVVGPLDRARTRVHGIGTRRYGAGYLRAVAGREYAVADPRDSYTADVGEVQLRRLRAPRAVAADLDASRSPGGDRCARQR